MTKSYESWGRYPGATHSVSNLHWQDDAIFSDEEKYLPYGLGRSYGDVCLNDGEKLISTRGLNRFIHFDRETGLLRCESGVSFDEILQLVIPSGWFLPVSPGTKHVTVGGAIANDVHGKNHHRAGTFGSHVTQFGLLRSDGSRKICSPNENADWYKATIGGLGLTGIILWAEFKLRLIETAYIEQETIKFSNLEEFFSISKDSDESFEYTVAWIDCLSRGNAFGRGLFIRGNHAVRQSGKGLDLGNATRLLVPCDAPKWALNHYSVKLFNFAYFNKQREKNKGSLVHYEPFFYPLDSVKDWNRIYGSRGFFQYQCVVPNEDGGEAIRQLLDIISKSGQASFLSVLKEFGDKEKVGLLSFPSKGYTLALDFPNRGEKTLELFNYLDTIVKDAGGLVYPAKDARMSPVNFQAFYPQWKEFLQYVDPKFSSSFWRRVTVEEL